MRTLGWLVLAGLVLGASGGAEAGVFGVFHSKKHPKPWTFLDQNPHRDPSRINHGPR
jgi:hypothetical protein